MKTFFLKVALIFSFFLLFLPLFLPEIFALSAQIVETGTDIPPNETLIADFMQWMGRNWVFMALVISEVAGLLPGKYDGIVQGILKFITNIVTKSKKTE